MFKRACIGLLMMISCVEDTITTLPSLAEEGLVNTIVTDAVLISTPNSHLILQGQGAKGVVVFNTGNPNFPYRAFDLGCPYIVPSACSSGMKVDQSGEMSCDCDGNNQSDDDISFTHFNTSVTVNDNIYHLVEYNTTFDGSSIRITNFNR